MCLCLLIGVSNGADFAKIFKDGMVLQADPTTAVIWGWQEGNPDDWPPVYLSSDCNFNMETFQMNQQYTSKKVKKTSTMSNNLFPNKIGCDLFSLMGINGGLKYLMLKEQNATLKSVKKEGYQLFSE